MSAASLPDTWPLVRLKDVASIRYGKALHSDSREAKGTVPVYGSSQTSGLHDVAYHDKPSIIIGRKGSVGSVQYVDVPFWPIDTVFFLDEVSPHVNLRFLAAALSHFGLERYKIVVGVPGLNRDDLANFKFPLPPLSEQQRIVDILQEAEDIRRLRAQAEANVEELGLGIFHQAVSSHTGTVKMMAFGDIARVKSGEFLSSAMMKKGDHPVYGGNGITGYHDAFMFEAPTVCIGRVGAYCGAVHLTQRKSWITDNALYVSELMHKMDLRYLAHALTAAGLNRYASQGGQPLISAGRIYPVKIPILPLEDQNRFSALVAEIEVQQEFITKTNRLGESLDSSLSAHAFTGQLTETWRSQMKDSIGYGIDTSLSALAKLVRPGFPGKPYSLKGSDFFGTPSPQALSGEQLAVWLHLREGQLQSTLPRYFTAQVIADAIEGPLHRHPQAIESHLTVFAVRGIVIPVSRSRDAVPGKPFAASYRLPTNEESAAPEQRDDVKAERMKHQRTRAAGKR